MRTMGYRHFDSLSSLLPLFTVLPLLIHPSTSLAVPAATNLTKSTDMQCLPAVSEEFLFPEDCRQTIRQFSHDNPIQNSILVHGPMPPRLGYIVCPYVTISGTCGLTINFDAGERSINVGIKSLLEAQMRQMVTECVAVPDKAGGVLHFADRKATVTISHFAYHAGNAGVGDAFNGTASEVEVPGSLSTLVATA